MSRKCQDCGAYLSSYNPGTLCFPCQEKKQKKLQEKLSDTIHYVVDDMCFLLGLQNPESVRRLGRKGTIPGKVPGVKKHLYLRELVDKWIRDAGRPPDERGEQPRESAVHLERQQQELEHRNDIRRRIENLKKKLEFPSPTYLWVPDDPITGKPVTRLGLSVYAVNGDFIEWEASSHGCTVRLDEQFDCVIEHLRSSRHRAILSELDEWKLLGGKCIQSCYGLRLNIEREAKERTRLVKVLDLGQRGLLDGFLRSVYWATFCSQDASQHDYKIVSSRGDLHLLRYAGHNLAWLREQEIEGVKETHRRLIGNCQNLPITIDVRQAMAELRRITDSLHLRLENFASLGILPGRCHRCPGS